MLSYNKLVMTYIYCITSYFRIYFNFTFVHNFTKLNPCQISKPLDKAFIRTKREIKSDRRTACYTVLAIYVLKDTTQNAESYVLRRMTKTTFRMSKFIHHFIQIVIQITNSKVTPILYTMTDIFVYM